MGFINEAQIQTAIDNLVKTYGEAEKSRIEKGVHQTARLWRKEDGTAQEFTDFCMENFISSEENLQKTLSRFEKNLESIYGHLTEMRRDLKEPMELDVGPMLPVDYFFANFSLGTHADDDFFKTKIAFVALLNFPEYSLKEKLNLGPEWTREEWAKVRLGEVFTTRIPSDVNAKITEAYVKADDYISNYNIHMHHVLTENGKRLFPKDMKLITHWNLRDELKSQYVNPEGLVKQEIIYDIMLKIITQEIPEIVIDNPTVDWTVSTNEVTTSPIIDEGPEPPKNISGDPEPDTRYQKLLDIFHAEQRLDPCFPNAPSKMARRFQKNREIPEEQVKDLFTTLMKSPQIAQTAELIKKRLGRELRSYDIWYNGFQPKSDVNEEELDRIVSRKYPDAEAFDQDIPNILLKLGFSRSNAYFLSSKIDVDAARGVGHAAGADMKQDNAHLRTRVPASGMNYKGYNIAVHELGHNVEQVLSLNKMDHYMLHGVPNTGFTEAFAFAFQARDLELLGLGHHDAMNKHLEALNTLWSIYEIAGVSLVDIAVWHWMYDHPKANAAELKVAVIQIAKEVWNEYFAPVFGEEDIMLLAIYSHMIDAGLYLPDYPLGHIIHFQVEQYLEDKVLGQDMERMCKLGSITPDAWMQQAIGESISVRPILEAAEEALHILNK